MTPKVLLRKLTYLRQLLIDLAPFEGATLAKVQAEHYKLERLFELLVITASDILFHELAELGLSPDSYRHAFKLAAEQRLLPPDLSGRLQLAAGKRSAIWQIAFWQVAKLPYAHFVQINAKEDKDGKA